MPFFEIVCFLGGCVLEVGVLGGKIGRVDFLCGASVEVLWGSIDAGDVWSLKKCVRMK